MLGVCYSTTHSVCEPAISHTYVLMKLLYQTALYRYSTVDMMRGVFKGYSFFLFRRSDCLFVRNPCL